MEGLNDLAIKNQQLIDYEGSIKKVRDFSCGEDGVKGSTNIELYLPPLPGHAKDAVHGQGMYNTYKEYAEMFPAVGRTKESYTGLAFRKNPIIKTPDETYRELFSSDGKSLTEFGKMLFGEVLVSTRPGVLVDVPETSEEIGTMGQSGVVDKPFAVMYKTENILDWSEDRINGELKTTFVKLYEEDTMRDPENEFDYIDIRRIRVLDLDDAGYYRHRIYESDTESGTYELVKEVYPEIKGSKMEEIPFFPISPYGKEWDLSYPPLNDLANLSMGWFRNSASYENGLLLAGSPTACIKGLYQGQLESNTVRLGAGSVLLLDKEGGDAFFLQIGSDGLSEIKRAMDSKKDEMAVVGARILSGDPNGVEASETAQIHRAAEHSVIMSISKSISGCLSEIFRFMYYWGTGVEPNPEEMFIELNVDFDFSKLDPSMLLALITAMQGGDMSREAFYYNLERGEVYPPNWTYEKEVEEISNDESLRTIDADTQFGGTE